MMNIKNYFRDFFKTRRAGWYILIGAAVLALIGNIIYRAVYADMSMQRYFAASAYAVAYAGIVFALALSFVRPVAQWSGLVLFGFELCSFCLFVNGTYMYLSSVFFAGLTAEGFASLDAGFVATVVFYVLTMIAAIVALFLRFERAQKAKVEKNEAVGAAQ